MLELSYSLTPIKQQHIRPIFMKRRLASFAVFSLVYAIATVTRSQEAATTAIELESGRELYDSACASCHAADGRGRSQAQLGFETPVPDFTDCDFAAREPDADWGSIIHEGWPVRGFDRMMPAFGDALSDREIELILMQVRSFCTNPDWPRGELNMPRALFTEKAYPEDEGVITTTIVTEGNDSISHQFLWEQRFGTRNQMEISLPVSRAEIDTGIQNATTTRSGAGDLGIGVKHVLRHSHENGTILSVGGELILATGNDALGFGKGTTVFEPYIAFGKLLPKDRFVQVQAFAEFPHDNRLNDEIAARVAVGQSFAANRGYGRVWTPMFEVMAARDRVDGATTHWDVVPQMQVTLNTRQHIMAAAGLRLPVNDKSGRETEFVFYLLWDWFDGGVREGW